MEDTTPASYTPLDVDDAVDSGREETKQLKSLDTYRKSIPYETESIPDMDAKLRHIVERVIICARTANWPSMAGYDYALQYWLVMHYPMPRVTRAALVKLYYELLVTPGAEPRLIRSWADMVTRLVGADKPGANSRRKLEITDLQLDWKPLWKMMEAEVWPSVSNTDATRTTSATLLTVADTVSRYFPASEIPAILDTILPRIEPVSYTTVTTLLVSFLPPTQSHLYVPIMFKMMEAIHSSQMNERLMECFAILAQEHISGVSESETDSAAEWKDVGIFTDAQWANIARAALVAMSIPVGSSTSSTTSAHADLSQSQRLSKKSPSILTSLSTIFIYSMSVDSPILDASSVQENGEDTAGVIAGSKALHSLNTIITSTETYFHPSNYGAWTGILTTFIQRLSYDFSKRWAEEQDPDCKTPVGRRLSNNIRRAFVGLLKTPALLAMFSKDPLSAGFAQGTLKSLSALEPSIIMPAMLERAYDGLESINETHRSTAMLSTLSAVASTMLTEKLWIGGQKHLLPLLELALPGLDINDPIKTVCATMFIISAVSNVKLGDLTQSVPLTLGSDAPGEDIAMNNADEPSHAQGMGIDPDEIDPMNPPIDKEEERSLTRDSTAAFADWVTSFYRRVFAIYENLPEEGGKSHKTGGKTEETVLKSVKSALDIVSSHLSDQLFDLVLRVVYDYATTNARANSVKAFGNLIASLAKAQPKKTADKFLPYCLTQIKIELEHGASSTRTTTTNQTVPGDTTLHWYISIARAIISHAGVEIMHHKDLVMDLVKTLVAGTKNERGFSQTGRLVGRLFASLTSIYCLDTRFVNPDEWNSSTFERSHNLQWGKLYKPEDVTIDWHVPSQEEVTFTLEILDQVINPTLGELEKLLDVPPKARQAVWRNDFCRYLHIVRSAWGGMPTIYLAAEEEREDEYLDPTSEVQELMVSGLKAHAGFILTDSNDPRYQRVVASRDRFGTFLHNASLALVEKTGSEDDAADDHIDAVMFLTRAIDTFVMDYAMPRSTYHGQKKSYDIARELAKTGGKQEAFPRHIWVKRAMVYHASRVHTHSAYRRRSSIDDQLINDLLQFSFSPYTRIRKNAQTVLSNVISYLVRSSRAVLNGTFKALQTELQRGKSAEPDRLKGGLYILWSKGLAGYALTTPPFITPYFTILLDFQQQEKPSIQQLVSAAIDDAIGHITVEAMASASYTGSRGLNDALDGLEGINGAPDTSLLNLATSRVGGRTKRINEAYDGLRAAVFQVVSSSTVHWKYQQWAVALLSRLTRKDKHTSPEVAVLLADHVVSDHPMMRAYAQRGVSKTLRFIKARTYSKTADELWLNAGRNPLRRTVEAQSVDEFLTLSQKSLSSADASLILLDKTPDGCLVWDPILQGYAQAPYEQSAFIWELESHPVLDALQERLDKSWFIRLGQLWSQEGNRSNPSTDLRTDHVWFVKTLIKMFDGYHLDIILEVAEPLWKDSDKFQQRAGAEFIGGVLRGSKHVPLKVVEKLWSWLTPRLADIFAQMTPDTVTFWDTFLSLVLADRDPRRIQPLLDFILNLRIDFQSDSVFALSKTLSAIGTVAECSGVRFLPRVNRFLDLYFDNLATPYAEIRAHIVGDITAIMSIEWRPSFPSSQALLEASTPNGDPLQVRDTRHIKRIETLVEQFPGWRTERLPGVQVSHSTYDRVGLAILTWIWTVAYSSRAPALFVYIKPLLPEILRMSELQDSSEVQVYSSAVLYVLAAIAPPVEFVEPLTELFIEAVKSSPSWRIRHKAIPVLSVYYFRNLALLSPSLVSRILNVLVECLKDENVEVREVAASTLSGILRCTEKRTVLNLKDRFARTAHRIRLPKRDDPKYTDQLRTLHSAVLGMISCLDAHPYVVEPWMPALIERLARHASDPQPVSNSIRKFASNFKKTHQDTWHVDQHLFDEDQSQALQTMVSGTSYYA